MSHVITQTNAQEWLAQAERNMREQEAADLDAGRIRLADLDSDDEYGGKRGRKKKGKRKKGKKNRQMYSSDEESDGQVQEAIGVTNDTETNGQNDQNDANDVETTPLDDSTSHVANDDNACNDDVPGPDNIPSEEGSSSEEESEPDSWRCECCRKDFKSEKQFDNHIKSKKHKETLKKYEKKLQKEAIGAMMNELG